MATLNTDSLFQSWVLTDQERLQGSILTITQKQCIQNQICQLASEKVNMKFDTEHFQQFQQREAELAGQIGALTYLLTLSAAAEKEVLSGTQPSGD